MNMMGFKPISFGHTMRNVIGYISVNVLKKFHQDGNSGDAVRIIIAEYEDTFLIFNG